MFCIECGTKLPDKARFCRACGEPQTPEIDTTPDIGHDWVPAPDQQAIAAPTPSHAAAPDRRRTRHTIGMVLLGSVVVGGGMAWAFAELLTKNRQHALDVISILSILLGIVGSLYLGYDLLGRRYGPLSWLTQFISCGLMGALVFGPLAWLAKGHRAPVAIVGGLLGALSGILIGVSNTGSKSPRFSRTGFWLGGAVGFLFWLILFFILVENSGGFSNFIGDYDGFLLAGIILLLVGAILSGFREYIYYEPPGSEQNFFSWRGCLQGFVNGFVIGIALWYVFGGFFVVAPLGGILVGIIIALGSAIAGGISRFIFNWANELPKDALGTFGLVLIMLAATLQFTQPVFDLISSTLK